MMRLMPYLLASYIALLPLSANAAIRVAITMDDLPLRQSYTLEETPQSVVRKTIAIFKKHHVPEVYGFINAVHLESEAKEIEQLHYWRKAGYPLGNHTYSHTDFDQVTLAEFKQEIEKNEPVLQKLAGKTEWKWLRFPYLSYSTPEKREGLFAYMQQRGYRTAYSSLDFQDWRWIDPYLRCKKQGAVLSIDKMKTLYRQNAVDSLERTEAISHAMFKRDVPYILLLHISEFNVQMLDELLSEYEKRGVTFITLEEAMKDPAYQQFGLYADKLDKHYDDSEIWQSWRGPLTLPGLTLDVYAHRPADMLANLCQPESN